MGARGRGDSGSLAWWSEGHPSVARGSVLILTVGSAKAQTENSSSKKDNYFSPFNVASPAVPSTVTKSNWQLSITSTDNCQLAQLATGNSLSANTMPTTLATGLFTTQPTTVSCRVQSHHAF